MKRLISIIITAIFLFHSLCAQQAKSVILIYLDGGPAQTDTFDPKPDAGKDYCGNYKGTIQSNVPGIILGEKLPMLAKIADKYTIIRSMTHGINAHETGHYAMITGDLSKGGVVYPSYGAVISYKKRPQYKGILPPYISVTAANNRFNEGGFLGNDYKSFDTGGMPESKSFNVEGIVNQYIDKERCDKRMALLESLETLPINKENIKKMRQNNMDFIWGESRQVFNLSNEPDSVRKRYGMNRLGQSCLVARRLVEAGVPFINVRTTGWDTHKKHFQKMNEMLPELDQALSALLIDLDQRGLLKNTIVLCGGEFGRTPKVLWEAPWNGGRAHFGTAFSYLVAGGGFKQGKVLGATDQFGEKITERPVYPCDLIGTVYLLMGIDPHGFLPTNDGKKLPILPSLGQKGQSNGLLYELIEKK